MIQTLNRKNEKGFTLIELMIVIAIIGILSAIAIPNFMTYREKGMDSTAKATANNFMALAVSYYGDNMSTTISLDGSTDCMPGYRVGDNIDVVAGGNFNYAGDGDYAGSVAFEHENGTKRYTVIASTEGDPVVVETDAGAAATAP